MTPTSFDDVMARLDPPLLVVTAASEAERAGCLIGFHSQCSIEPQRFAVWLSKANHTYRVALFSSHLAVHVVDAGDKVLAELFGSATGDETDKFARCDWEPGPGDVPVLTQCADRMVLERISQWDDGGDHVCFIGRPVDSDSGAGVTPMRVSDASAIEPGHTADEREAPSALHADAPDDTDRSTTDAHTRREYERAAAGAGHAVDLEELDDEPGSRIEE